MQGRYDAVLASAARLCSNRRFEAKRDAMPTPNDEHWMTLALEQAQAAAAGGEVPVGAVLVTGGELLAAGYNHPIAARDPTCHAEIHVLRRAARELDNYRLPETTLYVTIEPCTMCVGAMIHARVRRLVFGAREPRAGAVISQSRLLDQGHYNHRVEWCEGVLEHECAGIMREFFRQRRV